MRKIPCPSCTDAPLSGDLLSTDAGDALIGTDGASATFRISLFFLKIVNHPICFVLSRNKIRTIGKKMGEDLGQLIIKIGESLLIVGERMGHYPPHSYFMPKLYHLPGMGIALVSIYVTSKIFCASAYTERNGKLYPIRKSVKK